MTRNWATKRSVLRNYPGIGRTWLLAALLPLATVAVAAAQGGGIKTIDNPGGGQVVYGPMTNITSQRDAIVAMLRYVHKHFGSRPQIGKFFQARGSDSIATFFQLSAANQGNKPIAGMVIVSVSQGAKDGVAAVLYDDASRFGKTQPAMMKELNNAWHQESAKTISTVRPAAGSGGSYDGRASRGNGPGGVFGSNEPATSSQRLHLAVNGDNSASIGLPDGWHVTGGGGGSLLADGPRGEWIKMGILNQNIYDPHTQQGAKMIDFMRRGSTQFFACTLSSDLASDYQCVANQARQRKQMGPISMRVISTKTAPNQPNAAAILAEIDTHDGKGVYISSMKVGAQREGAGSWILTVSEARVPKAIADEEWPTIAAMIMTYRQNSATIQRETTAAINQINATAEANRGLAAAKSAANDAHNKQVDATWDEQARQNKAFENYTLDYSVLHDPSDGGTYGRATYPTADALVKADPEHFQIASTQDLIKGLDY